MPRKPIRAVRTAAVASMLLPAALAGPLRAGDAEDAAAILKATGVRGGLIVHVGCADGRLTAALRAGESYLVHGIDRNAKSIAAARRHVHSLGLTGKVSVAHWSGRRLPYIDNTVNLIVCEQADAAPTTEILRVLAPEGVAYVKAGGQWAKSVKPRPATIDDWTHFLHGPDNNAVAKDTVVGPPYHIQWAGEPKYCRSHQYLTSVATMVSAGGRLFYLIDEGPRALEELLPARWFLVARDAFNGVVLWKRRIASWQPHNQKGRIPFPPDLYRRLVAVGESVYATLGIFAPVASLDAATGKTRRTYEGTERTEEIVCDDGLLLLVIAADSPERIDRRRMAFGRDEPTQKRLAAVHAGTGKVLWTKEDKDTRGLLPLTLTVADGRAVFQNTGAVLCLDAKTGREQWRHEQKSDYARVAYSTSTVVLADGVVLVADRPAGGRAKAGARTGTQSTATRLVALAAENGRVLWEADAAEGHTSPTDVFVSDGLVWAGRQVRHKALDFRTALDLRTGAVGRQFGQADGWPDWHHHRCYREKATVKYVLCGRTGVEFIDLATGKLTPHHWVRGSCRYGILPCNGLIYSPPDQCACYIESKLCGFHALAPKRPAARPIHQSGSPDTARLVRGPAYSTIRNPKSAIRNGEDWPTYRRDAARSGRTTTAVPLELKEHWQTKLTGKLSSLVCAAGRLLVAQVHAHTVVCLDAETGRRLWSYTAGGRVDSPPTVASGLAVFGCRDGHVYALRAADGALAWRFRAAPDDRRLVAAGQIESVWPVHGSVLVEAGALYCAAGRNPHLDGGVYVHKLDLATGKPLLTKRFYSRDPETGNHVNLFEPFRGRMLPDRELPGVLPDIPSSDETYLYLRSVAFTRDLKPVGLGKPHLFCSMGFVDDTWWERTYWLYGTHMYSGCRGWPYAKTLEPAARIAAFDDSRVYGYQCPKFRTPGLFAADKVPKRIEPQLPGTPRRKGAKGDRQADVRRARSRRKDRADRAMKFAYGWRSDVGLYARAMVLANGTLFLAGPPRFDEAAAGKLLDTAGTHEAKLPAPLADAMASFEGGRGGLLWAVRKTDGKKLAEMKLDAVPVFDGMIAAGGRLFLATTDGRVLCLRGQ